MRRKWNRSDIFVLSIILMCHFSHLFIYFIIKSINKYWCAIYDFFFFRLFPTKGCWEEKIIMVARSVSSDLVSCGARTYNDGVMKTARILWRETMFNCDIVNISADSEIFRTFPLRVLMRSWRGGLFSRHIDKQIFHTFCFAVINTNIFIAFQNDQKHKHWRL